MTPTTLPLIATLLSAPAIAETPEPAPFVFSANAVPTNGGSTLAMGAATFVIIPALDVHWLANLGGFDIIVDGMVGPLSTGDVAARWVAIGGAGSSFGLALKGGVHGMLAVGPNGLAAAVGMHPALVISGGGDGLQLSADGGLIFTLAAYGWDGGIGLAEIYASHFVTAGVTAEFALTDALNGYVRLHAMVSLGEPSKDSAPGIALGASW